MFSFQKLLILSSLFSVSFCRQVLRSASNCSFLWWTVNGSHYRTALSHFFPNYSLLDSNFFRESSHRIVSFKFFKLCRCVLVKELVNWQIPTTNSNVDPILINSYSDTLGTKLVNTFRFTHKHDFKLLAVGEIINVLC